MQKTFFGKNEPMHFCRFGKKGYSLFSCLGREVLIGTLSIATLTHAQAEGVSVNADVAADNLSHVERQLGEVLVTGSRAPLTQSEAAKIVSVITREDIDRAAAESVNDLLKLALGVDVRQRGGFGIQTDISIGGGTFDQVAILLNGVNISNPHTGHLSADFPVALDDILRIEVIEGAASRIFGASAFNGAINIVTKSDAKSGGSVALEGGSFGTFGASARGALAGSNVSHSLSAGFKQSDGATYNSDFRQSQAFYQGNYKTLDWQVGMSTKRYGANTFYSSTNPNQYESNARFIASVKNDFAISLDNEKKIHIIPTLYWNRTYDHYQWIRNTPKGENFHRADVYGMALNAYTDWALGRTAIGAEVRKEDIYSTSLGIPLEPNKYVSVFGHGSKDYTKRDQRTDNSFYLEHNVLLDKFTASAGVVANMNTGYNSSYRFYPGVDLSYRPTQKWKLAASWNMAFRMPTFTDLFYKSPSQEGNKDLKPENTQSLRLSAQYRTKGVEARVSGFYDWGTDMIDWVMYTSTDIFHSANFSLDNRGYEVNIDLLPREWSEGNYVSRVRVGYAFIDQKRKDDTQIFKSNYAMEYLRHKFVAGIDHRIIGNLSASWAFRWQDRMGSYIDVNSGAATSYNPFGLLDVKLLWTKPSYELSLSMNNLTSYRYYDLGNIEQPGFWLMAGAKVKF